jgi:XTP/dITP diphosphohydrolase
MLRYVTTNEGKVREAEEYLDSVSSLAYDYPEIQADSLEAVAAHGARAAHEFAGEAVLVDDAGLYLEGFDGFPGPYSAYVEDTLGVERVGRLARREDATRAQFRCVIAYCDGEPFEASPEPVDPGDRRGQDLAADERASATTDGTVDDDGDAGNPETTGAAGDDATDAPVKLFAGAVPGTIVEPRGDGGFGYDPIFEHDGQTFAEMSAAEKNAISHRGRALATFAEWYQDRR